MSDSGNGRGSEVNGSGSGWSGITGAKGLSQIDVAQLTDVAANKALKSQKPRAIEPGRYTTILEPRPAARFLSTMMGALSAYAAICVNPCQTTAASRAIQSSAVVTVRSYGTSIPRIRATMSP